MTVNINLFEILIPAFKEKLGEKCPEEAVLKDIIASTGGVVANILQYLYSLGLCRKFYERNPR